MVQEGHRDIEGERPIEQPAPKPYDMVPLPDRVERQRPIGHDHYHPNCITGQIKGTIEALSPIHVASGAIELDSEASLIKSTVRTGGVIVIPGSSVKGGIRAIIEAITESCVSKTEIRFNQAQSRFRECHRRNHLCVACRLFGGVGFQGNISVHDAPMIDGNVVTMHVPELYAPRRSRVYFDESGQVMGRKFYMHGQVVTGETPVEAYDVGSRFRFSVQVDNLTEVEWGLIFVALGHHHEYPFKLKIGGAKPACLGSIDIKIEHLLTSATPAQRYLDWEGTSLSDELLDRWQQHCMDTAMNRLVKQPQLAKLAEILRFPNERNCPSGMY